ncbi:hypothetical protein FSP39_020553 [Pinctada imbricata]|uniref:G-protein coupled receptors family 1 profile domain-containing protein n=1 Tax=Pinctada imbricata TaxID=66713 RepID=A0AA88YP34_PINIB|nr:hypothetical protein FSP39_020553 [Pinctada imbricata]
MLEWKKIVRLVVPIVFCLMMVIGVMGNGILIYIVLANKCMKNVPNILIVTLSIGDLMMLIVSVPFVAVLFTVNEYPFNNLVCKANQYLQTFSMAVSIFILTTLSGNRYVAVAYPLSKHKGKSTLKIVITVTMIWILSALLAIPDSVSFHTDAIPTAHNASIQICRAYPPEWESWYPKAHSMFRFITLFVIPLIIIGIFYCLMARILVKSTRQLPVESTINSAMTQQQQRQIEARVKAANFKVVLMFVVLFVICWLPRHIYLIGFTGQMTHISISFGTFSKSFHTV